MPFGRRELSPVPLYLVLTGGYAFFFGLFVSVNIVFQVQEAQLNPLQLVLVGTVLEATVFLYEVPTGIVADLHSRRLSVIMGLVIVGAGLALAATPDFWTIIGAHVLWGSGYTFISGAQQAWIADEVGAEAVGPVYLRSAQVEQFARMASLVVGVGLATLQLSLPMLAGGFGLLVLAALMTLTMPERGFKRRPDGESATIISTFAAGVGLVRRTPLLVTLFCIAAFYGMAGEGVDRLWIKHFFDDLGFPAGFDVEPVVWFGAIRMVFLLLSTGAVELIKRRVDTQSHRDVSRGLFAINSLQIAAIAAFALSGDFTAGVVTFSCAAVLSTAYAPLYLAWINQNVDSSVRATVISMSSQVDALGQITGGPVLGAVGTLVSIRAALIGAAASLSPALLFYARAFKQGAGRDSSAVETGPASSG